MELVIIKARAQLNRLVSSASATASAARAHADEPRSGAGAGGREAAGAAGGARAGPSRERDMRPAAAGSAQAPAPALATPWLTATLAYNATRLNLTFDPDYELLNATAAAAGDDRDDNWFCAKWTNAQQDLFQAANLCFAIAFLVPKSFKQSILVLRALAAAGAVLMAMWAGAEVCAPDVLAWSLALLLVNTVHTIFLIIRFLPPALSLELTELYLKLFKPLKVNKKHFQELTREAHVMRLDPGEAYAVEEVTPADERLSILIKGKMRVSCDETHLHYITPYQFVDSPEWEANREQSDDVFQDDDKSHYDSTHTGRIISPASRSVISMAPNSLRGTRPSVVVRVAAAARAPAADVRASAPALAHSRHIDYDDGMNARLGRRRFLVSVVAEEVCTCVCWPRMRLERVLRHRPALKVVFDSLIGKDITHKLYSVSEGLGVGGGDQREGAPSFLTRSASVDAVSEGTRGRLRSATWQTPTTRTQNSTSYWQPVVARQFLRQSPFGRAAPAPAAACVAGGAPPRLFTQVSSVSLQPPARRRSPPRRAASFRRAREVKFAEPVPPATTPASPEPGE